MNAPARNATVSFYSAAPHSPSGRDGLARARAKAAVPVGLRGVGLRVEINVWYYVGAMVHRVNDPDWDTARRLRTAALLAAAEVVSKNKEEAEGRIRHNRSWRGTVRLCEGAGDVRVLRRACRAACLLLRQHGFTVAVENIDAVEVDTLPIKHRPRRRS